MSDPAYQRLVLKLSGEVLAGDQGFGIEPAKANNLAQEIKLIHDMGVSIGLVIGAGNIFRGIQAASKGMQRVTGDYLGMLATIMNAISIQDALEKLNVQTRTLSAITVSQISEPYIRRRALRHLEKNRVVIVAGGTGNPYFTTDTAASLRAAEIDADLMLKSTRVEGVFDEDPERNNNATKYDEISYKDVVSSKLKVMDLTAITLCEENEMPIRVFDGTTPRNIYKALTGESMGTLIK